MHSLAHRGYQVLGPTIRDGAVVYGEIEGIQDLPQGQTDEQAPGRYWLASRPDAAVFGYAAGPQSWKKYLHPAQVKLFDADRQDGAFRILNNHARPAKPLAFLGVRACDLAAIEIQDRVFLDGPFPDPIYRARRENLFVIAVACTAPSATCFCASMGTGPQVREGAADLTLTEVVNAADHWFLALAGSDRGRELLAELEHQPATEADLLAASAAVESAARRQTRRLNPAEIRDLLNVSFDHPRWDRRRRALPGMRQLHHGLPHVLLHHRRRRKRRHRRPRRALAALGLLLHPEFFLHPRRQRADLWQVALPPVDDP